MGNIIYLPFDKSKDPYYSRPIIDSKSKLHELMRLSNKNIWIVLGLKSRLTVSSELKNFIDSNFHLAFDDSKNNKTKVYYYKSGVPLK